MVLVSQLSEADVTSFQIFNVTFMDINTPAFLDFFLLGKLNI
jgi:hypothetical protein